MTETIGVAAEKKICATCLEPKLLKKFEYRKDRGNYRKDCYACRDKARRDRKRGEALSSTDSLTKVTTVIKKDELTGALESTVTTVGIPADPEEFMRSKGIDTDKYQVLGGEVTCNTQPMKLRNAEGVDVPSLVEYYRVYSKFLPRTLDPVQFGLEEYKWSAPTPKYSVTENKKGLERVLVIPDIHFGFRQVNGKLIPTHDPKALSLSLKLIDHVKPNMIVCSGDVFDFSQYGRHPFGVDVMGHVKPTLNAATEYFHGVLSISDCPVHLIDGNHDGKRLLSYIRDEIKKLSGVPGLEIKLPTMSRILGIVDKNIFYHGETTEEGWDGYSNGTGVFKYRDVNYIHGEKTGKNAVEDTLNQFMGNVSMGHLHKYVLVQRMVPQVVPVNGSNGAHEVKHVPVWGMCPGFLGSTDAELPGMSVARNYQKGIGIWNHVDMSGGDWEVFKTMPTLIPINDNCLAYNDLVLSV